MRTSTETTRPDRSIEDLALAFNRTFETLVVPAELVSDDVFFDLYPPFWRFQVQGREHIEAQLRSISQGPCRARVLKIEPTAHGFVLEHEERQMGGDRTSARRLWLCTVRDGRIVDAVGYCNGEWDDALRARHAAEAPMLRP